MAGKSQPWYGVPAIILHWLMAVMLLAQLLLGMTMSRIADQWLAFELIQLHKSIGFTLLGLLAIRVGWRAGHPPPALPVDMPPVERAAARLVHLLLYLLMLVLPLTGWALVSVSMLAIPTMPFNLFVMPNLPLGMSESGEAFWGRLHAMLAWIAASLVSLHALAALRHHFRLRDDVLRRMLWRRPDR